MEFKRSLADGCPGVGDHYGSMCEGGHYTLLVTEDRAVFVDPLGSVEEQLKQTENVQSK